MRLSWHRVSPTSPQEIEICSLVCLLHVPDVHLHVTAVVRRRWWNPLRAPARELIVGYVQMQAARLDVDLDEVSFADERKWTADRRFGTDMQDDGTVRGAA